ncbi:MAG: class I SAM-dependent methyltransferase [Thermoplasmatales archaeon]
MRFVLKSQIKAWNREYRLRGRLWRGERRDRNIVEPYLSGSLILDDGCGDGKGSPKKSGVVSIDFSIHALRLNPSNLKIVGDMTSLPFRNSTFDVVLLTHSIDHLMEEGRRTALSEASRVLIPGGFMIIRVFSRLDFRFSKGKEVEEGTFVRGNGILTHYFNPDEIAPSLGMTFEKREKIDYYINIQGHKYLREEYIIIFKKLKSENS